MKKLGAALIACILLSGLKAQFRIALTGGANQSQVLEENNNPAWDSLKNGFSRRTGFHVGVLADIRFSPRSVLYFQPGVIFTNKGRKFSAAYDTSTSPIASVKSTQYINYMDIPINLVLKFPIGGKSKFIIGAGPYVSFFYNGKEGTNIIYKNGSNWSNEKKNLEVGSDPGQYESFNYGVNGLLGFEFGPVFFTAKYSRGLSDSYRDVSYENTFKHEVMSASLGILIGKSKSKPKVQKPKDKDKDGIVDAEDECPGENGTVVNKGCPDTDGDGIIDKNDKCPELAGTMKHNGCPVPDKDGDGVNDDEDKCPDVPGIKKYNGCGIPDADKDGVNDELDKCPTTAGSLKYNGCPVPDTDKDGINDDVDVCPTVKGTKENKGCPKIAKEIVKKVDYAAKKIQFEYRSSKIRTSTHKILDEVAKILKDNPTFTLRIEGHTSNDKNYFDNMKLSQMRADNVKKYLESKGIESYRLVSVGYGPSKPLNKGNTEAEKALNRRVVMKLGY